MEESADLGIDGAVGEFASGCAVQGLIPTLGRWLRRTTGQVKRPAASGIYYRGYKKRLKPPCRDHHGQPFDIHSARLVDC
jgi:hypothetical protein